MPTHRCDECNRDIVLSEREEEWLRISGEFFYCPYCKTPHHWPDGSMVKARRAFVSNHIALQMEGERTDRYANLYHAERRRNAALRGVITKLKKAK